MKRARATSLVALVALGAGCASGPRATGTRWERRLGPLGGADRRTDGEGSGNGALIGAGLGALLGMLIGDVVQRRQSDPPSTGPPAVDAAITDARVQPAVRGRPDEGGVHQRHTWLVRVYVDPSTPRTWREHADPAPTRGEGAVGPRCWPVPDRRPGLRRDAVRRAAGG